MIDSIMLIINKEIKATFDKHVGILRISFVITEMPKNIISSPQMRWSLHTFLKNPLNFFIPASFITLKTHLLQELLVCYFV